VSVCLAEFHGVQEAPANGQEGPPRWRTDIRIVRTCSYYRTEELNSYAQSRLSGPRRSTSDRGEVGPTERRPAASLREKPAVYRPGGRSPYRVFRADRAPKDKPSGTGGRGRGQ